MAMNHDFAKVKEAIDPVKINHAQFYSYFTEAKINKDQDQAEMFSHESETHSQLLPFDRKEEPPMSMFSKRTSKKSVQAKRRVWGNHIEWFEKSAIAPANIQRNINMNLTMTDFQKHRQ